MPDSDDDDLFGYSDETVKKRVRLMREVASRGRREKNFIGGIVTSSESESNAHSTSASLSAAEKKGLKEVEELERELDLKNTFSKETNRRDEDAEMNKYIEEQIRQRREAAKREREKRSGADERSRQERGESDLDGMFTLPTAAIVADAATEKVDDILLHTLAKNYSTTIDEKSEAMLSNQMLNGIPEVDLGISERMRTIEATEEAKLTMASSSSKSHQRHWARKPTSIAPINFSSNFQQHRSNRGRNDGELKSIHSSRDSRTTKSGSSSQNANDAKTVSEPVVMIGEEPKKVEVRVPTTNSDHRPPMKGRASDDYYLQKFKKNNRR